MESRETTSIDDLFPDELFLHVFSFFNSYTDIVSLHRVSKRWSSLSNDTAKHKLASEFGCEAPVRQSSVSYYVALSFEKELIDKYLRVHYSLDAQISNIVLKDDESSIKIKKVIDKQKELDSLILRSRRAFINKIETEYKKIHSKEFEKSFAENQNLKKTCKNPGFIHQYEKDHVLAHCNCDTHHLLDLFLKNNLEFLKFICTNENDFILKAITTACSRLHLNTLTVLIENFSLHLDHPLPLNETFSKNVLGVVIQTTLEMLQQREKDNPIHKLTAANKIIALLLKHGASPDSIVDFEQPTMLKEIYNFLIPNRDYQMKIVTPITIRRLCSKYLANLTNPKFLCGVHPEELWQLKGIFELIIQHRVVEERKAMDDSPSRCRPM